MTTRTSFPGTTRSAISTGRSVSVPRQPGAQSVTISPPRTRRPTAAAVWREGELEALRADRRKIDALRSSRRNLVWDLAFATFDDLIAEHGTGMTQTQLLKDAVLGVQSALGISVERYFAITATRTAHSNRRRHARNAGKPGHRCLSTYLTHVEFGQVITQLRMEHASAVASEGEERIEKLAALERFVLWIAEKFLVTAEFVRKHTENVDGRPVSVTYPDSVSQFCDGSLVLAEHKLSGRNDSKAVEKNVSALRKVAVAFAAPGRTTTTVIALPFDTYGDSVSRWRRAGQADLVAAGPDVWGALLGTGRLSEAEYGKAIEEFGTYAGNRMFHYVAPADLEPTLDEHGHWDWQRTGE